MQILKIKNSVILLLEISYLLKITLSKIMKDFTLFPYIQPSKVFPSPPNSKTKPYGIIMYKLMSKCTFLSWNSEKVISQRSEY